MDNACLSSGDESHETCLTKNRGDAGMTTGFIQNPKPAAETHSIDQRLEFDPNVAEAGSVLPNSAAVPTVEDDHLTREADAWVSDASVT